MQSILARRATQLVIFCTLISLHLLVVGTTTTTSTYPPCTLPGSSCQLPADIQQWNTILDGGQRFWGPQDLEAAFQNTGDLYHASRLLAKLNRGQRLIVAAIGSSFIWEGGSYDKDGPKGMMHTFGAFMHTIDRTWHNVEGHAFWNFGRSGASLDVILGSHCMSAYPIEHIDLLILEPASIPSSQAALEVFARRFLAAEPAPALIVLSNTRNSSPRAQYDGLSCLMRRDDAECAKLGPEPYDERDDAYQEQRLAPYQQVAALYGATHINMYRLVKSFLKSSMPARMNLTQWQLLRLLYRDELHFSKTTDTEAFFGPQLLADLLVFWLRGQQQGLAALSPEAQQQLRFDMPPPLLQGSLRNYESRCYSVLPEHRQWAPAQHDHTEALDSLAGRAPPRDPHPVLNITRSDGFNLSTSYVGAGGIVKHKPGYVATKPGAVLEFQVDSDFLPEAAARSQAGDASAALQLSAEVVVTYTKSYDGWSNATLSCVSGCHCSEITLVGHHKLSMSILEQASLRTTAAAECILRVALPTAAGLDHKFKVSYVLVRKL